MLQPLLAELHHKTLDMQVDLLTEAGTTLLGVEQRKHVKSVVRRIKDFNTKMKRLSETELPYQSLEDRPKW